MKAGLTLAGIALCLGGCYAPGNDRLAVNNIETLGTEGGIQQADTEFRPLRTISRRDWAPTTYVVPVDSTIHAPTYAPTIEFTDKTARERGARVTIESAYELSGGSRGQQVKEGFAAPFVGLGQGIMVIPLLIIDRPTNADESPSMAYQRSAPATPRRSAIRVAPPVEIEASPVEEGG